MDDASNGTPLFAARHEDDSPATTRCLKPRRVKQPAEIDRALAIYNFFHRFSGVESYPICRARPCAINLAVFACPLDRIGSEIILHMVERLVDNWQSWDFRRKAF
jgi:hypothetical protein